MKTRFTKTFLPVRMVLCTTVLLLLSGFTKIDLTVPVINFTSVDTINGTGFRLAVSKGANVLATLQFDVIYISINSTTGCTNEKEENRDDFAFNNLVIEERNRTHTG